MHIIITNKTNYLGNREKAFEVINTFDQTAEERYVPSYFFAIVYAGLGENNKAIEYLERAYQEREFRFQFKEQAFDILEDEPDYIELSGKIWGNPLALAK